MGVLIESQILKYSRTRHLEDSRLQPGDEDMGGVPFSALPEGEVVYEEKIVGGNAGFRFDGAGEPHGQSRGHYLDLHDRTVARERDYNLFKDWLLAHRDVLLERFEDRFVVFGEWMQVAHTIFYDRLPHLFLGFDIYDLAEECFLDTPTRRMLCEGLPIVSVPVLYRGRARDLAHKKSLVGPSCFRTPLAPETDARGRPTGGMQSDWRPNLRRACSLVGDDCDRRIGKVDGTGRSEGLYVKVERDGRVVGRCKWVRPDFTQAVLKADEHWRSRFPVPNLLDGPTDLFPDYLWRSPEPPRAPYDPDRPWLWAPWIPAASMACELEADALAAPLL